MCLIHDSVKGREFNILFEASSSLFKQHMKMQTARIFKRILFLQIETNESFNLILGKVSVFW